MKNNNNNNKEIAIVFVNTANDKYDDNTIIIALKEMLNKDIKKMAVLSYNKEFSYRIQKVAFEADLATEIKEANLEILKQNVKSAAKVNQLFEAMKEHYSDIEFILAEDMTSEAEVIK